MAETITDIELLQYILKSFDIDSPSYKDKTLQTLYINLSIDFKSIDRVDNIANIIYGFSEQEFENLKRFFGLIEEGKEDYFSGFVGEIKDKELKTSRGTLDKLFSEKFSEHIRLCCFQRDFMTKSVRNAEEMANKTLEIANKAMRVYEKVNETIDSSEETAKSAKEIADKASALATLASGNSEKTVTDLNEMKTKIYSEFIGILGIFTAVAFMVMGSLELLNNLFSDISNPTSRVVGYVLVAGGIYLLVLYLLMVSLFVGMKKVTGNGSSYDVNDTMFKVIVSIALILVFIGVIFSGGIVH
ncbi:hypothetical protein [Lactococcus lactis]|uniref:hypothetical protein n=1 Tax=Lactococcus lactis TaxID=1358 RepID=UPI0022E289D4|nr:hypothetical protein [Lactococcus lactis]